jgi:hypothetical protein
LNGILGWSAAMSAGMNPGALIARRAGEFGLE